MAVRQYFDCSTAHVTRADAEALEVLAADRGSPLSIIGYQEGFFIYVSDDPAILDEVIAACALSPSFEKMMRHVHGLGIPWIRLDCDGDDEDELDHHDW